MNLLWLLVIIPFYISCAELMVFLLSRKRDFDQDYHYLIVLGANGNVQSTVVQDRVHNATEVAKKYPKAKIILTGNESKGEVTAYRQLLGQKGYQEFIDEKESTNTWENVVHCEKLIGSKDAKVLLITSEYHQPRALTMARVRGWKASAYGVDQRIYERKVFFFWKERISNVRYFPIMLAHLLKSRLTAK